MIFSNHPLWQMARFGVIGGLLTLMVSALYLVGVQWAHMSPQLALTLATILASVIGFFAHGSISFRGHGERDRLMVRMARSGVTNFAGFLLNMGFVFAMVDVAHLPKWTPTIPFCFVTPLLSFVLNRKWVFG